MYLEAISDGKRFLELAKKITAVKPLVVLKAGKTARGVLAVSSHTGSLAPENKIFEAACAQAKVINVETIVELFDLIRLFNAGIYHPLKNLGVVTNGGGPSIVLSDLIELSKSLSLATLKDNTKTSLREVLPPTAAVNNPVDLIGDALADRYTSALKILSKIKELDALAVILTPQKMTQIKETAKIISKINKKKILLPLFIGGTQVEAALKIFRKNKIAYFTDPKNLVKALDYLSFDKSAKGGSAFGGKDSAIAINQLDFTRTQQLLQECGLFLSGVLVKNKDDLSKAAESMPGPYALKAITDKVLHKSDVDAVKINLKDANEVNVAWEEISKNILQKMPEVKIEGVLLQSMVKGREVIVGMKRDVTFGPTIVFGLGGVFVEILKDVAMRIAPLNEKDADGLIEDIKGANVLHGTRGQKAINFDALKKVILAISKLAVSHPEIKEMDFNPIICTEDKAEIVDVRMV